MQYPNSKIKNALFLALATGAMLLGARMVFHSDNYEDSSHISVNDSYTFDKTLSGIRSENYSNNLDIKIKENGFELTPLKRRKDLKSSYSLQSIKINENQVKLNDPVKTENLGSKLAEHHGPYSIHYTNDERGLRQDFVIHSGPLKNANFDVEIKLETNMRPYLKDQYSLVLKDKSSDMDVLYYKDLLVYDADGKFLTCKMQLTESENLGEYNLHLLAFAEDVKYPITIDPLSTSNSSVESSTDSTFTGYAVEGACDVNGDGFCDAIVSSYGYTVDTIANLGKIEIFLGTATGVNLSAVPDFTFLGDTIVAKPGFKSLGGGGSFGYSLDCGKRLNTDIYDDFIVGAPSTSIIDTVGGLNDTLRNVGAFYIFYGGPTGFTVDTVIGDRDTMRLGYAVAGLGNIDNVGESDIMVSAPGFDNNRGGVFVYRSTATGLTLVPTDTLLGSQLGEQFGTALAGPGDVNGGARPDLLIGAHNYTMGTDTAIGKAYLFLGKAGKIATVPAWTAIGEHKNAQFGYSVSGAGNFDGLTTNDVLIGSDKFNPEYVTTMPDTLASYGLGSGKGKVYVYAGRPTGLSVAPVSVILPPNSSSGFGSSVAYAGDVDGDLKDDILVGAPRFSNTIANEGVAYGYYGANYMAIIDTTFDWCAYGEKPNAFFGSSLGLLGGCSGDNDTTGVIVGAYGYGANDAGLRGAAFTFKGKKCGLTKYAQPVFLTFPKDTIFANADFDTCGTHVHFDYPKVGTNCPGATLTISTAVDSGGFFKIGDNVVTFHLSSEGQTKDSSFVIRVYDDQSPKLVTCPMTQAIIVGQDNDSGVVTWNDPTFKDNNNCSGGPLTITQISGVTKGSTQPVGVYLIVYEAEDGAGNKASCTFRVVLRKNSVDGTDCVDQSIISSAVVPKMVSSGSAFEYGEHLTDRMNPTKNSFGIDLLFSLFEGATGLSIPPWVKAVLGQVGTGIDIGFVSFSFNFLPSVDMEYGVFYNMRETSPLTASMNYNGQVCAQKPADTFFGCRDTIDFSNSFLIDPNTSLLNVNPGGLEQEIGIYIKDFIFRWRISISASACIGLPIYVPFHWECLGYSAGFSLGVDVFTPIKLLDSSIGEDVRFPIMRACDAAFGAGAGILTAIQCLGGPTSGASDFVKSIFEFIPGGDKTPLDPFYYSIPRDEFVFDPNRLPKVGNKIPEMDISFGRLTQNEMGPTFVNGTALTVSGVEKRLFNMRLDVFSLLYYALPKNIQNSLACSGIDIGTKYIVFGEPKVDPMTMMCSVPFYRNKLSLDLLDLNVTLSSEYRASYSYDPQIKVDSMNLGAVTYWERPAMGTNGVSQKLDNIAMDETVRFVVPDGQTDAFFIRNEFSALGNFVGSDTRQQKLTLDIQALEFGPSLWIPSGIPALIKFGPWNIANIGAPTTLRSYNNQIAINGFGANVSLQPDNIKPVIATNDTTVQLNDDGFAFLDAETAFDRANSYDLPIGGSGSLNLIDVFPDTVFCANYPSFTAYIVVEDDNCNFDTAAFLVTVMDTLKPRMACVDVVVGIGPNGTYVINPDEIAIGVTDNCRNVTVTASPAIFTCADIGIPRDVTINVVDVAGNTNFCIATVTVVDTLEPEILCPYLPNYPAIRSTAPGVCIYIPNNTEFAPTVVANDCNTMVTYALSGATVGTGVNNVAGVPFNLGETVVTYTATDASNNSLSCSFSVIVEDNEAPIIACPDNVTIGTNNDLADDYNCSTDYTFTHPSPFDNCTAITFYSVTYTYPDGSGSTEDLLSRYNAGNLDETRIFDIGTTSIEYLAKDTMDNEIMCLFTVKVVDDEAPMIFCEQVIGCQNYAYDGYSDISPNDQSTYKLIIPNDIKISDLNVILSGNAQDMGLLSMTLMGPDGTTVDLFNNLCAGSSAFNIILDDEAALGIGVAPCGSINAGLSYIPLSPLSDFDSTSSQGEWTLIVQNDNLGSCGSLENFTLQICGNEQNVAMATIVSILASDTSCEYKVVTAEFDPPFIDNCSGVELSHDYIFSPTNATLVGTVLPLGQTTVTWTATDTAGNTATCVMIYEVKDQSIPEFINCPEPDVIREAEPSTCGAYVNFALPLAFDDCDGQVAVTQIDGTGLSSGSLFPVGMSVLIFQATDKSGNTSTCSVRVIVNDTQNGLFACPANAVKSTDPGVYNAVVNGIAPTAVVDNCNKNASIAYQVEFPINSGIIIHGGVADASGNVFPKGVSKVKYKMSSQPLLLISEVSQDIQAPIGGMDVLPYTVSTNNDYIEITNLGAAAYNISGLIIERFGTGFSDVFEVPNLTILQAGETLVVHYGNGTDDLVSHFFNMPCAVDISTSEPAGYMISFKNRPIDVVTTNGYDPIGQSSTAIVTPSDWSGNTGDMTGFGGLIRKFSFDNNIAKDWEISGNCNPLTIGSLNPDLKAYAGNGSTTALQSIAPQMLMCDFTVTVNDLEAPSCREVVAQNVYNGGAVAGGYDSCNESDIMVPSGEDCLIEDINVTINGTITGTDSAFIYLTSPSGIKVRLIHAACPAGAAQNATMALTFDDEATNQITVNACGTPNWTGSYVPQGDSLLNFYGDRTAGVWTLSVGGLGTSDSQVSISSWSINITCLSVFQMADVVIDNEPGVCGSEFSWIHPYFIDNSNVGDIMVTYTTDDADCVPTNSILIANGGQAVTQYFCVGTTTVSYSLTDENGNVSLCSFKVTVVDAEDPVLNLANCQNILIQLGSTLCNRRVIFNTDIATIGTDNCGVVKIEYSPASGTLFPIGITPVTLTIFDEAGNTDQCTFNVEVLEFVPADPQFSCNNLINLSLDETCMTVITPSMVLTGAEYRCFDNFCLSIKDSLGKDHANIFTLDDIGDSFRVTVSDCVGGGNSCWGTVHIDEKLIPVVQCPKDTIINCGVSTLPESTGFALLKSCEPKAEIYYEDYVQTFGQCDALRSIITRKWVIDDHEGNIVTCNQKISIRPITLNEVEWPKDIEVNKALECNDVVNNPDLIEPINTGYPKVAGQQLKLGNSCMISIIKTDEIFPLCEGSYVIARTWKILSACQPLDENNPRTHTQALRVFDTTPPVMEPCPDDMEVSTSAWVCYAESVELPIPAKLSDVCGHVDIKAYIFGGGKAKITGSTLKGDLKIYALNLSKGIHTVLYRATDGCGNVTECTFDINVVDETPPVATAKKNLVVSLTSAIGEGEANGGIAKIFAKDIDNGSYDNCSGIRFEIRRDEGPACGNLINGSINGNLTFNNRINGQDYNAYDIIDGGLYVKFCCDDVNAIVVDANGDGVLDEKDKGYHAVQLRVWDDGNMDGEIGGEGDNYNDTWTFVKVEDKLVPKLYCESDTLYCDRDNYYQLVSAWELYSIDSSDIDPSSVPHIESACNGYSLEFMDEVHLNSCKIGYINRTWRILGTKVNCTQRIEVRGIPRTAVLDYPIAVHLWEQCTLTEEDVLANAIRSTKAAEYGGSGDGGNTAATDGSRVLSFRADYRNVGCELFGRTIHIDEYTVGEGCKKWLVRFEYVNWCENNSAGSRSTLFKYEDNIAPKVIVASSDTVFADPVTCKAEYMVKALGTDEFSACDLGFHWEITVTGFEYNETLKGEGANPSVKFKNLSPGKYEILYKLRDGCGNIGEATSTLIVIGKDPTPYCVSISSAVMKDGIVELWARDFDKNSYANCIGGALYFTFFDMQPVLAKIGQGHYFKGKGIEASEEEYKAGLAQKWLPEIAAGKIIGGTSGKLFGCKVGDGSSFPTSKVNVTVWDKEFKHDYCEVTLSLIDNNGSCGGGSRVAISGTLQTETGPGISQAQVKLEAALPEFPIVANTDSKGNYEFGGMPVGIDYDIKPSMGGDFKNGINTLDLIHIQRHILSIKKLESPYKMIAADANGDAAIRVEDMVVLRKLILGITNSLPDEISWRFVNTEQQMGKTPWPFAESASHASIMEPIADRFIGVKIGDVDNTVKLNFLPDAPLLPRSKAISMSMDERWLEAGQAVDISLNAANFTQVFGFQLSGQLKGLTIMDIEGRGIDFDRSNFAIHNNQSIVMSWSSAKPLSVDEGNPVLVLHCIVTQQGKLSSMLNLNNDLLRTEAYVGESLETGDIEIQVRDKAAGTFALGQNEPNPWRGETFVAYELPQAGKVKLTVIDITGKTVAVKQVEGNQGRNTIGFTKAEMGGISGVLIYKLESGGQTAQKKMILIE